MGRKENIKTELGQRIRSLRKEQNRADFCLEIGVNERTYANYERGTRVPDATTLVELSNITGVDLHWLLTGTSANSIETKDPIEPPVSPPTGATSIPILGLASCGPDGWARLETSISRAETPTSIRFDKDAFAVTARGESMLPFGITEGVLCYCSPATELNIHDIVCIERHIKGSDEISLTIKKLGIIGTGAYEIIGYEPLEESPSGARHGNQYQKLIWEVVPFDEIARISVVTHIYTRPTVF